MQAGASVRLWRAPSVEASQLNGLAVRSKAYWAYADDFLAACRTELTHRTAAIADAAWVCVVAERDTRTPGLHALRWLEESTDRLDHCSSSRSVSVPASGDCCSRMPDAACRTRAVTGS